MAYTPETLIIATTAAVNSAAFRIGPEDVGSVIQGFGFSTDTIDIARSYDGGTTFEDYYKDGTQQQLSDTNTAVKIVAVGFYRLQKGATTGTVGAILDRAHLA